MPNHVWTNLEVKGCPADIAAFKVKFCEKIGEVEHCLVFNRVIPMPEELQITCGSESSLGKEVVAGDFKKVLNYPWVIELMQEEQLSQSNINALHHSRPKFLAWFEKHRPEAIELGRKVVTNIAKYGYETWYEWSIANWGTKWDAYNHALADDSSDSVYRCYYETAWSPAYPVLEAMSGAFPELSFRMAYADEGGGFAGVAYCNNGGLIDDDDSDYRQICIDEFGYSKDDFYEDECPEASNDSVIEVNHTDLKLVVNHG